MREFTRAAVVPFLMAVFPALWFVNRNVTTAFHWPHLEPSPALTAGAVGLAVVASAAFAAVVAVVVRATADGPSTSHLQRVLQPDDRALGVLAAFVAVLAAWALVAMVGVGPAWLEYVFWPVVVPIGLPLFVLFPFAMGSWAGVVIALACCALWMAIIANGIAARTAGPVSPSVRSRS